MEQKNFAHNEDIGDDIICAKLLLVDLAGKGRDLVLGFQSVTKWFIR